MSLHGAFVRVPNQAAKGAVWTVDPDSEMVQRLEEQLVIPMGSRERVRLLCKDIEAVVAGRVSAARSGQQPQPQHQQQGTVAPTALSQPTTATCFSNNNNGNSFLQSAPWSPSSVQDPCEPAPAPSIARGVKRPFAEI